MPVATEHDYAALAAAERQALGELLRSLSDADWETQSLCEDWSVRQVAAHLAANATAGGGKLLLGLITSGFSPERQSRRDIARHAAESTEQLAAEVSAPELHGLQAKQPFLALAEAFLHQQDIRRPLGKPRQYPRETLQAMLDATVSRPLGTNARSRCRQLHLRATDVDWSYGEGEELSGPAEALIMALNGRVAALGELTGDGVEELAERLRGRRGHTGETDTEAVLDDGSN